MESTAGRSKWRSMWPSEQKGVGRIALWLSTFVLVCLLLRITLGAKYGDAVLDWAIFAFCVEAPFLLILLLRLLNRRVLWKVRNRLIVTYVLMGLAPLVLFATLMAIIGYGLAGQYSINSALSFLDEAADQLKGEITDVAGIIVLPDSRVGKVPFSFEENSNPREAEISFAELRNGQWRTVELLSKRGLTPVSPFEGLGRPAWLTPGTHSFVVLNGKLYLCREAVLQEENRRAEVIGALELNHKILDSMVTSLGRMLVFSGFSTIGHGDIDKAEVQAKTAEQEADTAEQKQEAAQQVQEHVRDRLQDAREQEREAQQDAGQALNEARQQLEEAQSEARRAGNPAASSADDKQQAQEDLGEAQQAMREAQKEAQAELGAAAKQLQSIPSIPGASAPQTPKPSPKTSARNSAPSVIRSRPAEVKPQAGPSSISPGNGNFTAVSGGTVPPAAHLFDPRVYFTAPLPIVNWADGHKVSAMLVVISRPGLLYTRLFATSVDMGSLLRDVLIAIAIFFAFLEGLALWMAIRLSRTITRSVAELYRGTTEIDGGNLTYRVKPQRPDQLGALANSFNTMAGSISDLLIQQREKERLLSELAIAQEVQGNLFPHSPVSRPGLDLHAVCLPARTVSGDYFDFIFEHGRSICIALGDISGKGISAALLMASLHSAVRAFSLGDDSPTPSPAHLLSLLNQHLFSSTQANKYATLFLAFYNPEKSQLTYANGGHLPPFLVSKDGSVRRLEAGGSVVGLLDNLQYEQASVQLQSGDLLAVFSDGLTEPEHNGIEFGEDRLLKLIQKCMQDPLPSIVDQTFNTLGEWIGTQEQPDDMTLLLARQL